VTAVRTRPTANDAFRLARRRWLAGERVDMSAMAAELDARRGEPGPELLAALADLATRRHGAPSPDDVAALLLTVG